MENLYLDSNVFAFVISALLWAFLWIRHEMVAHNSWEDSKSFMWIRTMSLLSVLWVVSTFIESIPSLPLIVFWSVVLLISIAYANWSFKLNKIWLTTEFTAILVFWIWALVWFWEPIVAIVLTIFIAGIDTLKEQLHSFAWKLSEVEWIWAIQMLALSWAVLPFLPRYPVDPLWVFVPFNIWLLVMMISGIWFVWYFLNKYFWTKSWVALTSFLWALVSSTAVTISLAIKSKKVSNPWIFATWLFIALATMQFRVVFEILILWSREHLLDLILFPLWMAVIWFVIALYYFYNSKKNTLFWVKKSSMTIESPFELKSSLKFAGIFIIVIFSLAISNKYFWNLWIYITSLFTWLIDVDVIVLSALESMKLWEMEFEVARNAIALSVMVNTFMKIIYIALLWSKELLVKVIAWVLIVIWFWAWIFFI